MLVLVCVAHQWICFCFAFPLRLKDKIDAGKTPRSVSLRRVTYFANISAQTNF